MQTGTKLFIAFSLVYLLFPLYWVVAQGDTHSWKFAVGILAFVWALYLVITYIKNKKQ